MKKLFTTLMLSLAVASFLKAQNTQTLPEFNKITISPKIAVELVEGSQESISWEAIGVEDERVNIEVKNNRLYVYLDDAKITVKGEKGRYGWKYPMYDDRVVVKAKITYAYLKKLEIRGEQKIKVHSDIVADKKFTLKAYGTTEIEMAGVQAKKFKAVIIGENELYIASGLTPKQKVKSIGENVIDFGDLNSYEAKTTAIGENILRLNVRDYVRVTAIGESQIKVSGNPYINKGWVIGENYVSRR